ncbi:hypothetical protein [Blastococcus sp. VKM Ac-2987]|uniref:hypothetical protein n=1 Tax=Blastococcus sp. VKM Ac-2987 TaxID=3004141 RepID=UPI0022AB6392|nr:hypothetical protein [Blastococcus sp. VKM Ac-2987]MCZ2858160.1 hypothetical protein [Blastococcus sp. VKM Ac-2987]
MRLAPALLAPLTVLALAGCGGDPTDETAAGASTATSTSTSTSTATVTSPSSSAAQQPPTDSGSPQTPGTRPAPDTCTDLPESADGGYAVADAGTVTVTRNGDRLVLGQVAPAAGWETESVEEEDREIEVEFRGDGIELDFEAEIEDGGRLDVEVCHDDD